MTRKSIRDWEIELTIDAILRLKSENDVIWMDGFDSTGEDLADYLFDLLENQCNGAINALI